MRHRAIISIAVLAIAFASGCAKKQDDAAIVANIKSQMVSNAQLKDANVQVASSSGTVTLSGTVASDATHLRAYKLASETPGVKNVNDQLAVQVAKSAPLPQPTPASAPIRDRRRKAKAKKPAPQPETVESAVYVPPPDPEPHPEPVAEVQPAAPPQPPPPAPRPQPKLVQIPSSSTMTVRMIDGVDSSVNHPGEIFHAALEAPLVVDNQVIVPRGADVYVRLSNASSAGHMSGKSELHLELLKMDFQGQSYPLVSSTYSVVGSSRGQDTAKKVGGAAVIGAIIGAVAGGGRGAAIGAGVGAGGGAVYQGATKGKQVKVPSETKLDFQLAQPLTVTVLPRSIPPAQ
jgi:hypothetical protein